MTGHLCLLFLPPSIEWAWYFWKWTQRRDGEFRTWALSVSTSFFSLCPIHHLHTWHSLHTHTHTHTHHPCSHCSPPSPLRSSSSCVRTERTHAGMNHSESCSPNSTQREVLHLTRTQPIYNGLGVHTLIMGHGGCWQWTGRWEVSEVATPFKCHQLCIVSSAGSWGCSLSEQGEWTRIEGETKSIKQHSNLQMKRE